MKKHHAYLVLLAGIMAVSSTSGVAVLSSPASAAQAASSSTGSSLTSLPAIGLQSGVSVRLSDMQLSARNSGSILTYTLTYTNRTSSPYKLLNTFSRVQTPQNGAFKGVPVPEDKDHITISPGTSQSITYYVNAQDQSRVNGTKISVYGWDFDSANYEKKLGTFTLPASYSPAVAANQARKIMIGHTPLKLKPEQLQIINFNGKHYARLTLQMTNLGTEMLESPGYNAYLLSSSGSSYALGLDRSSKELDIQPGATTRISYVAAIPAHLPTSNLSLQITHTTGVASTSSDATSSTSSTNLELPIVSFRLPAVSSSSLTVPVSKSRKLWIDGNAVTSTLKSASQSTSGDKAVWTMQFSLKNTGNKAVIIPAYEASIASAEGYTFPIQTKTFSSLTLKPLEEKLIQLSTEVPLQLKQQQLKLQLLEPATTTAQTGTTSNTETVAATASQSNVILPTAFYMIPYSQEQSQSAQTEYTFDNNYGSFGVTLESLQRMPWTTDDIVAAKIRLRNAGSSSVTLPELGGWMKAQNNRISSPVQIVAEQTDNSLDAGASRVYYIVGRFNSDVDLAQLKIELYPTTDTASTASATNSDTIKSSTTSGNTLDSDNPFLSLYVGQTSSAVAKIARGSSFHIQTMGKKAEIKERRTITYEGASQKIAYTELDMKSEEKRTSLPSRLVAYYKTPDNEYYEATVNQSDKTVGPDGKSLITIWSKLPSSVNTSQLTLYIGEAINDGKVSTATATPTGYINAVELALNTQTTPVTTSVSSEMELFPYRFAITGATGSLTEGQESIAINMTYNLSKDNTYTMGTFGHNLIIQWVDPSGQMQEKTMVPGTDLTPGKSVPYATTLSSSAYKNVKGGHFTINVYDEFEGERILLGMQSYRVDFTPNIVNTPTTSPTTTIPSDQPTTNPDTGTSKGNTGTGTTGSGNSGKTEEPHDQ
ncbi:hypothetical protein ACE3MZ_03515 [Paenibacillus sp. WLX1005]|uniref:hypothetical protein n=1 Tax=Paenibacillus sp. WLX1005 TaxID=3243766 RepID=UPI003983F664